MSASTFGICIKLLLTYLVTYLIAERRPEMISKSA